jgi:hypothetical protein
MSQWAIPDNNEKIFRLYGISGVREILPTYSLFPFQRITKILIRQRVDAAIIVAKHRLAPDKKCLILPLKVVI